MKEGILDRLARGLVSKATPAIQREMRTLLDGQSQWDHIQHHDESWIEIPAGRTTGATWEPRKPLKVRPGEELGCFKLETDGTAEVKFEDLRRLLAIAEERW